MIVTAGKTNVSVYYYIVGDASHASPGDPITGLLFSDIETGGSASYVRQGAARVDFTLITLASASAAHSDGGFIEVDATNMPGVYRCDYPDAAFVTGVDQVICHLVAAAANNAAIAPVLIDITDVNLRDSVRGGMTALPNAAADAAGGLPISDTGGLDLDALNTAAVRLTAARAQVLDDWINAGRLDLILDIIAADVVNIDGAAMRGTDNAALATALATAQMDLDTITGADGVILSAAGVDLIWDEPIAGHLAAGTAGLSEALGSAALVDSTITGTPTTTTFDFAGGSTSADFYNDQLAYILSGTGIGQVRAILSSTYSGGTTTIMVDEPFIVTPVVTDRFAILVSHVHPLTQITANIDANSTQLAAIVADTNELQTDLTNGGRLDLILDELTSQGDTNEAAIGALNNLSAASVLTQVNAALDTAIAELGVGAPTATPTLRTGLMLMYMMARNRVDVDTTGTDALKIYNDAGTQIASKAITDDGTDYSEAEMS